MARLWELGQIRQGDRKDMSIEANSRRQIEHVLRAGAFTGRYMLVWLQVVEAANHASCSDLLKCCLLAK